LTAVGSVVTDNTIIESGNTGLVTNGTQTVFSSATFDRNTYIYNDTKGLHWVWNGGGEAAWTTWRGYENDRNGSLTTP
jgi:hypothetical protein